MRSDRSQRRGFGDAVTSDAGKDDRRRMFSRGVSSSSRAAPKNKSGAPRSRVTATIAASLMRVSMVATAASSTWSMPLPPTPYGQVRLPRPPTLRARSPDRARTGASYQIPIRHVRQSKHRPLCPASHCSNGPEMQHARRIPHSRVSLLVRSCPSPALHPGRSRLSRWIRRFHRRRRTASITVPAMLIAGIPPLQTLGTNKVQSVFGAASATIAYARKRTCRPAHAAADGADGDLRRRARRRSGNDRAG